MELSLCLRIHTHRIVSRGWSLASSGIEVVDRLVVVS